MRNSFTVKQSLMRECHFRSKVEFETAVELEDLRKKKIVKRWQYEKSYFLKVNGRTVCEIIPDFTVLFEDGRVEIWEVKGGQFTKTREWSLKKKLFKALYPHIEYITLEKFLKKKKGRKKQVKSWDKFRKKWIPVIQM